MPKGLKMKNRVLKRIKQENTWAKMGYGQASVLSLRFGTSKLRHVKRASAGK